ncbi:hypothetical protein V5799_016409, partial [Amblyomma americanum]
MSLYQAHPGSCDLAGLAGKGALGMFSAVLTTLRTTSHVYENAVSYPTINGESTFQY